MLAVGNNPAGNSSSDATQHKADPKSYGSLRNVIDAFADIRSCIHAEIRNHTESTSSAESHKGSHERSPYCFYGSGHFGPPRKPLGRKFFQEFLIFSGKGGLTLGVALLWGFQPLSAVFRTGVSHGSRCHLSQFGRAYQVVAGGGHLHPEPVLTASAHPRTEHSEVCRTDGIPGYVPCLYVDVAPQHGHSGSHDVF